MQIAKKPSPKFPLVSEWQQLGCSQSFQECQHISAIKTACLGETRAGALRMYFVTVVIQKVHFVTAWRNRAKTAHFRKYGIDFSSLISTAASTALHRRMLTWVALFKRHTQGTPRKRRQDFPGVNPY